MQETLREGMTKYSSTPRKAGMFCKKENIVSIMNAATLKWLVQGGQLYSAFPFSKDSLPSNIGKYKDGSKCQPLCSRFVKK